MSTVRLDSDGIAKALKERERALAGGLAQSELFNTDDDGRDLYEMVLKRRRMAGFLQQALRDEGFDDIAKRIRWKKEHLSEGNQ